MLSTEILYTFHVIVCQAKCRNIQYCYIYSIQSLFIRFNFHFHSIQSVFILFNSCSHSIQSYSFNSIVRSIQFNFYIGSIWFLYSFNSVSIFIQFGFYIHSMQFLYSFNLIFMFIQFNTSLFIQSFLSFIQFWGLGRGKIWAGSWDL